MLQKKNIIFVTWDTDEIHNKVPNCNEGKI